jgi:hypothetical protein
MGGGAMSEIYREHTWPYTTLYVDAARYPDASRLAEGQLFEHKCHCSPGHERSQLCDMHAALFLAVHPEIERDSIGQASAWHAPYWRALGHDEIPDNTLANVIDRWIAQERQP